MILLKLITTVLKAANSSLLSNFVPQGFHKIVLFDVLSDQFK